MLTPVEKCIAAMAHLRSPQGCPWDIEQTHQSIAPALLEECHETIEAIHHGTDDDLREELGDLLLHVLFHAQIATEGKRFTFDSVCDALFYKLVSRHPHVFKPYPTPAGGETTTTASTPEAVIRQWNEIKKREKPARTSVLDGVPKGLPALAHAQKVQKHAARVGFDWADAREVLDKVDEEVRETRAELDGKDRDRLREELGDLLFSLVNLVRKCGLDAEEALLLANHKFERRFRAMEQRLTATGRPLAEHTLDEMNAAWDIVKAGPAPGPSEA